MVKNMGGGAIIWVGGLTAVWPQRKLLPGPGPRRPDSTLLCWSGRKRSYIMSVCMCDRTATCTWWTTRCYKTFLPSIATLITATSLRPSCCSTSAAMATSFHSPFSSNNSQHLTTPSGPRAIVLRTGSLPSSGFKTPTSSGSSPSRTCLGKCMNQALIG